MNSNEKFIKTIIAVIVVLGVSLWVFNMVRPQSYEGVNLEFPVGEGVVQVTNASEALSAQFISSSSRSFRVSSTSDDISGSSITDDSDEGRTQVFEFMLPSGMTAFTVVPHTNVRFEANASASLSANIYPLNAEAMRIRIIGLFVLMAVVLFYISQLYDHLWISAARRQDAKDETVAQEAEQANFDRIMRNSSSKR